MKINILVPLTKSTEVYENVCHILMIPGIDLHDMFIIIWAQDNFGVIIQLEWDPISTIKII